jgi:hypothetical protein
VEGDARSYVERTSDQYDLIYMNLVYTQAVEPASQTLVENYIFTREAMKTFLDHLTPGGRLTIISHNGLEASRAAITALQAMNDQGINPSDALDHLWLWMYPANDNTLRTSVLVVGKDPLPKETVESLSNSARAQGMQALFTPGDYEILFANLRTGMPLDKFIQSDSSYNLFPTTDDQPYFFNLDLGLPPAIRSSLVMSALLAVGLLLIAVFSVRTPSETQSRWWWLPFSYAALIGVGFMLVEVPLIQRFQLLLGQPILSLAAVLATLLLSSGLGSLLSQRWQTTNLLAKVSLVGIIMALITVVYWFVLPSLVENLLETSYITRLLATLVFTAIIGFPMGIPFPSLLRVAKDGRQQVALLWAVNGVFSVLGSTLATVISMQWGFKWALLAGAGCYLLMALVAWLWMRFGTSSAVTPSLTLPRTQGRE